MAKLEGKKIVRILQRDGYQCAVPGCMDMDLTVDHIVARANGGTNDRLNLQTMCRRHNQAKGIMANDEFRAMVGHQASPVMIAANATV